MGRPLKVRGLASDDGTFRCDACASRQPMAVRHESGFCHACIMRGRSFWLRTVGLEAALALARELWGDTPARRIAA